jgi:hypothetical protein
MALPSYAVWFRGFPACPCLAAWLPVYEDELQRRGLLTGPLPIYQLIGDYAASGNTHKDGGAFDISDLVGEQDVWVARQMGADATWARTPEQGFVPHLHGVLRGCPHNGPAAYQITSSTLGVDAGWNGLSGRSRARDDGPRPLSGRTWREGIAWAHEQEDDMPAPKDWTKADWDAFNENAAPAIARVILDEETVELKKADGAKDITIRSAVQRILNPDE